MDLDQLSNVRGGCLARSASAPLWGANIPKADASIYRSEPSTKAALEVVPVLSQSDASLDTRQASPAAVAEPAIAVPVREVAQLMQRATEDLEQCRQFLEDTRSVRVQCERAIPDQPAADQLIFQESLRELTDCEAERRVVSEKKVMAALKAILEQLGTLGEVCQLAGQALGLSEWGAPEVKQRAGKIYLELGSLVNQYDEHLPQDLEGWLTQTAQCAADLGLSADCQEALKQAQTKLPQHMEYWPLHQACRKFFAGIKRDLQQPSTDEQ
jgi:hypothetical protein